MRYCFHCHTAEDSHNIANVTEPHRFSEDEALTKLIDALGETAVAMNQIAYQLERAENNRIAALTLIKKDKA